MIRKLSLLILLLALASCSMTSHDKINRKSDTMSVEDLGDDSKREPLEIDIKETDSNSQLGPIPSEGTINNKKTQVLEPAIALVLPDGKDIIPATLAMVRKLSKAGITPRIYAGVGLGAAMATALAFNLTADEIEWELFSLERKGAHGEKDKATALVSRYFERDLSQSFHVLSIPNVKGIWYSRGNIEKMLTPHLETSGTGTWRIRTTPNNFGADLLLLISSDSADMQVSNLKEKIAKWKMQKESEKN